MKHTKATTNLICKNHNEKGLQAGDTTIHDELVYVGQTSSGRIEIPLTGEQVKSICTQGNNDIAVAVVAKSAKVKEWMENYSDELLRSELLEYGNWTEDDLTDRVTNIERMVWSLAWDIFDSENPNDSLAADDLQY